MMMLERYSDQDRYDEIVEDEEEEHQGQERDEEEMESDEYSENIDERLRKATFEAKMLDF